MLIQPSKGVSGNSKLRSGCVTCKRRRVKCDEGRPHCQRCIKAKRQCEGYANFVNFTKSDQGRRLGTDVWQVVNKPSPERPLFEFSATESEWSAFAQYREKVAVFSGPFDKHFWCDFVLQLATQEPAIRHGVVAMGSFCPYVLEHMGLEDRVECHCTRCVQGTKAYNKALSTVFKAEYSSDRIHIPLLACLLFIGIEMMRRSRGQVTAALATSGIRLLTEDKRAMSSPIVRHKLLPAFTRIRLGAFLFDQIVLLPSLVDCQQDEQCILTGSRSGLELLRDRLFGITASGVNLVQMATTFKRDLTDLDRLRSLQPEQQRIQNLLRAWQQSFDVWKIAAQFRTFGNNDNDRDIEAEMAAAVKCYYLVTSIWTASLLSLTQRAFEDYTLEFQEVLDTAASVLEGRAFTESGPSAPFTFELGFIPPIFFVAYRCRIPSLRRRAIALLELCGTSEATWDKRLHIALATRIMEIEEAGSVGSTGNETTRPLVEDFQEAYAKTCADDETMGSLRIATIDGDLGEPIIRMDVFDINYRVPTPDLFESESATDSVDWGTYSQGNSHRNITFRWFDKSRNLHQVDETLLIRTEEENAPIAQRTAASASS